MTRRKQSKIHPDLLETKKVLYNLCDFIFSSPIIEIEGVQYGACTFELNSLRVVFRIAKITPKKVGLFVTLWKRSESGAHIEPYHSSDPVDLFVISTRKDNHFGQFVFPKPVLIEKGILSTNAKTGKLGFRVYPPWDKPSSAQAKKTQLWQIKYFLEIPPDYTIDCARANLLYSIR